MAEIDWKREFESMGTTAVRGALIANRWEPQKRAAAREWLERGDAAAWQATRPANSDQKAASGLGQLRRFRWVTYIGGGAMALYGLVQVFAKVF